MKFKELKSNLNDCIEAVDLQQKVIDEHFQTIKTMESKISQNRDQSQNFGSNLENCKTTVENPSTKINNINSGNEGIASGPRSVLDLAELKDRVARMNNLIVYELQENDDVSDECLCTKIFDAITSIVVGCPSYHMVHTQRIGSKTLNKPQLLRVILDNLAFMRFILGHKHLLSNNSSFKTIALGGDKTKYEQKQLKDLRVEFSRRLQQAEANLTIKYRKGMPGIVSSIN